MSEAAKGIEIGAKMSDGSVFVGLTTDGKQQIYAMPADLYITMTFNNAAHRVERMNVDKAFGHDDWRIPDSEQLRILYQNKDKGELKGTFKTVTARYPADDYPHRYWSSTEHRFNPSNVHVVRFSDGGVCWDIRDNVRMSCRPVRLVASSAPSLG